MSHDSRIRISKESSRAPGLPYFPSKVLGAVGSHVSRHIPVLSINYDYFPMYLESPKVFWVDLKSPAPPELVVGSSVKLHTAPGRGIQTELLSHDPRNSMFEIDDIVGSRVILNPYKGSTWLPTVHAPCDSPFGWGYDTQTVDVSTSHHDVKYGYGVPRASLEYFPIYYSARATQLDAARMEEAWYRGSKYLPGWQYS